MGLRNRRRLRCLTYRTAVVWTRRSESSYSQAMAENMAVSLIDEILYFLPGRVKAAKMASEAVRPRLALLERLPKVRQFFGRQIRSLTELASGPPLKVPTKYRAGRCSRAGNRGVPRTDEPDRKFPLRTDLSPAKPILSPDRGAQLGAAEALADPLLVGADNRDFRIDLT